MKQHTQIIPVPMGTATEFKITVNVGYAQKCVTNIQLNGVLVASLPNDVAQPIHVKAGDILELISTVTDLPLNPNLFYVKHLITPGDHTAEYNDAVSDGESATYTTEFDFF